VTTGERRLGWSKYKWPTARIFNEFPPAFFFLGILSFLGGCLSACLLVARRLRFFGSLLCFARRGTVGVRSAGSSCAASAARWVGRPRTDG
jgi:hypothetical protein